MSGTLEKIQAIVGQQLGIEPSKVTPESNFQKDLGADSLVSLGIFTEHDKGLFDITKDSADIGKYKSVHLRNIAITAPYMHNGSKKTLREVVIFYNDPANFKHKNVHYDAKTVTFEMSDQQVDDMVAFMESLTDERYLPLLEQSKKEKPSTPN